MIDHLTLVFMGDSITEGQYVHHSQRWTEIVSARLRVQFADLLSPERQFHYVHGVSGETTRQGLERFPRHVQQFEPEVMTLQFGLNDCNCWDSDRGLPRVSEAAYEANLVEMVARAKCFGTRHIVLSTNHPTLRVRPMISGASLEQRRVVYNGIVRRVAAATSVTLCDIEAAFSGITSSQLTELLLPEPDVLHLSPSGHRLYADAIHPFLASAVKQSLTESTQP